MKTLSNDWKNYLASGGTSLAMCIKITLQDGTVYGFTTASREITYQGIVYYPAMGVTPSVIQSGEDMAPGNMEALGFFSADGVLMADVRAGEFDSALHHTFIVNYDDLSMGHIDRLEGPIGQFKSKGNRFTFELKDWLDKLTTKTGIATTPYCRVKRLGDSVCGVKMGSTFDTTGLSTSFLDAAGTFDIPFDATAVNLNIMNDGRLVVSMWSASAREYTIRDAETLQVMELLPDIGSTQILEGGMQVNQYGDMCNGGQYKKKNGSVVTIGVDFHTPCVMDLNGIFFVACRYTVSPFRPVLVRIELDGTFTLFDLPTSHMPNHLWHGQNGYVYLYVDSGGTGPVHKIDAATGAIVKTSTVISQFDNMVAAADDSVWYVTSTGGGWHRMEPTWTSSTAIFNYGSVGPYNFHETWARNWASGGVIGRYNASLVHYAADGTLIESIPSPTAITGVRQRTHQSFPDLILSADTRPVGGSGNQFITQVLRPVIGTSNSWAANTQVIGRTVGDAKLGSVAQPSTFNGLYYVCSQTGVTGGTEPAWVTTPGVEFSDGSAKWIGKAALVWPRTVATVADRHTFTVSGAGTPTVDLFKYGILTWLTGANVGVEMEVMSNTSTSVTTYLETPFDIQIGDICQIERGCDRSKEMCTGDFSNIFNFDGEPQKPAADFLLSYTTR